MLKALNYISPIVYAKITILFLANFLGKNRDGARYNYNTSG